jgi:hypothetical protein
MPFGKYKGRAIEDVPETYLRWVLGNCRNIAPALRCAIRTTLADDGGGEAYTRGFADGWAAATNSRNALICPDEYRNRLDGWLRRASVRFHPDRGGSAALMKSVSEIHSELLGLVGDGAA